MATIALVLHPSRDDARELADRITSWLESEGHTTVRLGGDLLHEDGRDAAPAAAETAAAAARAEGADLFVSLGGDGTMLRTVDVASTVGVPVLGVNLGRLGYLTEVEPAGLDDALRRFLAGDYAVDERMTLQVRVERAAGAGRPVPEPYLALNDAVVEKTVPGHTVRLATAIAGRPFVTYAADGVLVATPTGSTAYNLSARGPIVSPGLRAVVVTPISPHQLFDRPLVLEPDEPLRLEVVGPRAGVLVIDGRSAGLLEPGDAVVCGAGPVTARFVTFGRRDFHAVLKARFHLADR